MIEKVLKKVDVPFPLYQIDIINSDDEMLKAISDELGLSLSVDEMRRIKEYFIAKGRNPYDIELQALGQAWSEHCCYKSSKYYLKQFIFNIESEYVISAIKEDAGVVEFDEDHAYVVAFESHNHPSAIEPYGGAATGIGGILRDVVCMGAKPVALIDPLFFGKPDFPHSVLPKGTKHPLYLLSGVVAGIRDYGNRVGIPTVSGMIFFDNSYLTNCLVNVGCIGIAKKSNIVPSRAGGEDDIFILAGGLTGRDGIHGVTFASAELKETSEEESRGAVQLGNPIIKEPLIHACLEVIEKKLITGMKDLGGGGLSCAVGEMALAAGFGARVFLDRVPLKEPDMAPWEIWVSESQERMMITAKPEMVDEVLYVFEKWDVPATVVGEVKAEKTLEVYYKDFKVYDMDIEFVTSGPEYCRSYLPKKVEVKGEERINPPKDYLRVFKDMLQHPNVASREWVIRQYDHQVRASTILRPLQGRINRETHGDSAIIKPTESWRGLAITADVNPWMTKIDPFWGTASSFDEMIRNLIAVNSKPHSFVDCLNFGNPEKPERMGEFVESVKAMGWMARGINLPCVSGNVSFYNETPHSAVAPTPTLLGIGIIEDIRNAITSYFKRVGSSIVLVGETEAEFGGSVYSAVTGQKSYLVPRTSPERLKTYSDAMLESFKEFKVLACHDISGGGLAIAIAEMCFGKGLGAEIDLRGIAGDAHVKLFSESNTRWIVELPEEDAQGFIAFLMERGCRAFEIGCVSKDSISFNDSNIAFEMGVSEAEELWRNGLSRYVV
ncbi:phosphoribosylformylglycinamidine synthase subunit II [Archaeoglobus sulfaticallidus PM70-1]|uniref:Phosphoribosylformylglycinamidine synthase subunit PurL n=1 Tax=Archaeoglobus sulfaticallidus PM70-1 TaxID=387631 RepID=N0BDN3_9EURY|nr:phosphoribosylformylglycinamidine synthase subunit PurL [Archaeoglobus sulfaticallidus]AGK61744.1 phosphoribosylformylglycinamidine synthase subunit II [Archaeoglobus sulfaticallidus PM70-1]